MADEKVLIDVEIKATQALKELAELKMQAEALQRAQATLDKTTERGREEYAALGEQIKAINSAARERSKVIQNEINQQNLQSNSLNQMGQRLSAMKKAYRDLSEEERKSAKGQEMAQHILDLNNELKEAEQAYGVYTRNVGNYQNAINSLFPAFGRIQSALDKITNANGATDKSFASMAKGMGTAGKQAVKFGAQLLATPIGWIAAAVAACAAVFMKLADAFKKNDDAGTALSKLFASFQPIITGIGKAFDLLATGIGKVADGLANLIARFSDSAAAAQELVVAQDNLEAKEREHAENSAKRSRDIAELRAKAAEKDKYTAEERMAFLEEAIKKEGENLAEQKSIAAEKLRILEEEAKKNNDTSDDMKNKLSAARAEMYKTEEQYYSGLRSLQKEYARANEENAKADAERAKNARENYEKAQKSAADAAQKRLQVEILMDNELAAQTEAFLSDDFATRAEWEAKEFARKEQAEKDKLDIQLRYGQISKKDYDAQYALLGAQRDTFEAKQLASMQKYYKDTIDAARQLIGESEESELAAMQDTYDKQLAMMAENYTKLVEQYEQMLDNGVTGDALKEVEAALMENAAMQVALEEKKEKEIKAVNQKYRDARNAELKQRLDDQYAFDLAKARGNEEAKLAITRDYLAKQAELIAATYGIESLQYIEAMNAIADFNEETATKMQETAQARFESIASSIEQWANKAMESTNAISNLMRANEEREVAQYEDDNERKNKSLEKRLDQGLISQEEYDRQVAANDAELDRKKAEITLKQAKREKALSLMQAAINTATAIMQIWAQVPKMDFGASTIALTAVAAALGAVQMATIAATPLPKAAKGGVAGGGLLVGPSHADGGIPLEAEGGEAIINKRSTAKYRGLLSAINADGGGVRFAMGGIVGGVGALPQDGGYAARHAGDMAAFPTAAQIADACAKIQTYVAVTDINRGQANYAKIVNNAKF